MIRLDVLFPIPLLAFPFLHNGSFGRKTFESSFDEFFDLLQMALTHDWLPCFYQSFDVFQNDGGGFFAGVHVLVLFHMIDES